MNSNEGFLLEKRAQTVLQDDFKFLSLETPYCQEECEGWSENVISSEFSQKPNTLTRERQADNVRSRRTLFGCSRHCPSDTGHCPGFKNQPND
jgi:hypothetical protein